MKASIEGLDNLMNKLDEMKKPEWIVQQILNKGIDITCPKCHQTFISHSKVAHCPNCHEKNTVNFN